MRVSTFAPGRVNLIGDHTDHTGGLVLPMAIQLGTSVDAIREGSAVVLRTDHGDTEAVVPLDVASAAEVAPGWARYVAGVVMELRPEVGIRGEVTSTLPVGAGLSSSAALVVSVALALGADGRDALGVARVARRAEEAAGVPCGLMDPLVAMAGRDGAALLIDTGRETWREVPLPGELEVVVVDSGEPRALEQAGYAAVRERCIAGEAVAAAHVRSENERVLGAAQALGAGDLTALGEHLVASHRSLGRLGVSTPALDRLVDRLCSVSGVHGARLTGAGFGGCVVALTDPGVLGEGWVVRPSNGAWVRTG